MGLGSQVIYGQTPISAEEFEDVNLEEIYAVTHKNNRNAILLLEAHAFLLQEAMENKIELKYRSTKSHD